MSDSGFVDQGILDAAAQETPMEAGDVNWEERYRAEVQDRIKERERYKPIKQVFDRMHPEDASAVQQFAQAWAAGDQDAAIKWMVDNAKSLAGEKFSDYVSPAEVQAVIHDAREQGREMGLTVQGVQQLVQQQLAEYQEQQQIATFEVEINQQLEQLGLDPGSALAHAVIIAASDREDLDLHAAAVEMENQILQQAAGIVQRRQSANAAMPSAAPHGAPGIVAPNMSPRDRAMARLEQQGL